MKRFFTPSPKVIVRRGLFIPASVAASERARSTRALIVRPVTALVPIGLIAFAMYAAASNFVDARFTQPANTIMVTTDTWPYQQRTLTPGPNELFTQPEYVDALTQELRITEPHLLVLDTAAGILRYYLNETVALEAPITLTAAPDSWRYIEAGYYEVVQHIPERYSSLEQAYYPNVLQLNTRVAIHGPAYRNGARDIPIASLGVTLSAADSAALYALATTSTPVIVHTAQHTDATSAAELIPRGPDLPVRSYIARDLQTGDTLAAYQPDTVVPIASLTKLMTAVVVAEEFDLEGEIILNPEQYVNTLIPRLASTTQTSIYDLLQLLLLESSNEAAEVLAAHRGRDNFIAEMNAQAAAIGLTDTVFTDPSGLDDGNQATANDLYRLVAHIHERYPFILNMSSRAGAISAARTNDFADLTNFNLIEDIDTFTGGKIGETSAARQTSATRHELSFGDTTREIVLIVLGSEARAEDVRTLHQYVRSQYQ